MEEALTRPQMKIFSPCQVFMVLNREIWKLKN